MRLYSYPRCFRTNVARITTKPVICGVLITSLFLLIRHILFKVPSTETHDQRVVYREEESRILRQLMPSGNLESVPSLVNSRIEMPKATVALGKPRNGAVYLTIGIPTVYRDGQLYLSQTLDSLLSAASPSEHSHVTIVVFLGDFNATKREHIAEVLTKRYSSSLKSGALLAIRAEQTQYPPLEDVANHYGDSPSRVRWRTKQVVDFAILWKFCAPRSQYYLQLEDDVITVDGYVGAIRKFVADQTRPWTCLHFSTLGFIGKLFRSEDLYSLSRMAAMFYARHPVDFILQYFLLLSAQPRKSFERDPALFQHIGRQSSLQNKTQLLLDRTFENATKIHHGDNPPGRFSTSLTAWRNYDLDMAYSHLPGFFWALSIKAGQNILLTFDEPHVLKGIIVETGSRSKGRDALERGKIEVSQDPPHRTEGMAAPACTSYVYLGMFKEGRVEIMDLENLSLPVKCIRIQVLADQAQWLILSEIAVFLK